MARHQQRLCLHWRRHGDRLSARHPLQDMEMYQFHPTGIYKVGVLLWRRPAVKAASLLNSKGEYFMERYMPTMKDLAPRDIVSRLSIQEVKEGRGVDGKDYVYLDVRHLGSEDDCREAAGYHRLCPQLPRRRADYRAGADSAYRALRDGRHSHRC